MGPDLVFVVINMTQECQKERLKERHGESVGDLMEKMFNLYEPTGEDEENAFNVTVDTGMSRQDVLKQVTKTLCLEFDPILFQALKHAF